MIKLPPLPECFLRLPKLVLPEVHGMGGNTVVLKEEDAYFADQLRSYGQACWEAALEAAAKRAQRLKRPSGTDYAEGRKDEREQWESVARLALAALNTCDGCDSDKGYSQWFVQEQVDNAIKALCALICPVCLGAGWVAERPGEQCACGLYSWEARK